ncbi:hypothetical protein L7F22_033322 [Adiantum nelumboides]|nr:hypothetical protein [Adiantum nelumboides]
MSVATDSHVWYFDSDATKHITSHPNLFTSFESIPHGNSVTCSNNASYPVKGVGKIVLTAANGSSFTLVDALYVLGIKKNLLSVSALASLGLVVKFVDDRCTVHDLNFGDEIVASGILCCGLYKLTLYDKCGKNLANAVLDSKAISDAKLCHAHFGHLNFASLLRLHKFDMVASLPPLEAPVKHVCEGCILGFEFTERLAYYGITANLVLYIKTELHQGSASATESVNNWIGATSLLPIFAAFLADAYLGRFWTVVYSSSFYILGLIMLTLSACLTSLRPGTCSGSFSCPTATTFQLAFFYLSLYLIAVGTAGVKPCLEALGADQFDEYHPSENHSKSSFFSWWYFGIAFGALVSYTVIVYIEDNGTSGLGYGILAFMITIAAVLFLAGTPIYRNRIPSGSSLVGLVRVLVAAARKWHIKVPHDISLLYETDDEKAPQSGRQKFLHTAGLRCLDKAATVWQLDLRGEIINQISKENPDFKNGVYDPWKLCTVTQVEEAKLIVRIFPIWLTTVVFGLIVAQTTTYFVQQAATMDRTVGSVFIIPSGSIHTFSSLVIVVTLPIYEKVLVPSARRLTGHDKGLSLLQRLGVGFFLSIVCMVTAALVEMRRLKLVEEYGLQNDSNATVPMSVFWLTPQYMIYGMADVFAIVGEHEFFYDQVPDSMRSLGLSFFLLSLGLGSYLSTALISVINVITSAGGNQGWLVDNLNQSRLDYFYWFLAVLFTLNFVVFLALSWSYTYKGVQRKRLYVDTC